MSEKHEVSSPTTPKGLAVLRDVQPVVPAAVQHEPSHEAVTGLAGATIVCSQVVTPLFVVQ